MKIKQRCFGRLINLYVAGLINLSYFFILTIFSPVWQILLKKIYFFAIFFSLLEHSGKIEDISLPKTKN